MISFLRKANNLWREAGLTGLRHGWANVQRRQREDAAYRRWIKTHELTREKRADLTQRSAALASKPLISIILPVYNVDEKWLRRCIDSVVDQIYANWELCIADDASPSPHVRKVLDEYAAKDDRIKVVYRDENGHISLASNSALELATGEFIVLLDHDDELSADALFWVANELNEFPETSIIYSDEDLIDENGRRFAPKFKPDFSRDLMYSLNLMTHLSAYRTDLVREVGGFRAGFEGSQDYDLGIRVFEQTDESRVRHIPRVLYHWRVIEGSVAFSMDEKPYAHERARKAIREHFERTGVAGEVHESFLNLHRVSYSGDICVEVIGVDRSSANPASTLNAAAAASNADVIVFVDRDLKFMRDGDADELARFAMQEGIGAVGGRILGPDMFVEQAGLVLDADLSPRWAHAGYPREAPGNMFRNRQVSNYSAISISCFAIRRELFEEMDGFDLTTELFDVDLCLRLREQGKRIVVLPHVELQRLGNKPGPRIFSAEFRHRWREYSERDPYCNANLKRDGSFDIDA